MEHFQERLPEILSGIESMTWRERVSVSDFQAMPEAEAVAF